MSIASALETALSGLHATQAQIQVVSSNVANVQTPGYSREVLPQETVVTASAVGVSTGAVQRVIDQVLNNNLVSQTTTANAASTLATFTKQIETLLGQVGSGATINNALNQFSSALQAAATTPQDPVAQGAAVSAGQALAQTLNQLSTGVQNIRQGTDVALGADVNLINNELKSIAATNAQISQLTAERQSTAALEDQRDQALKQVSQLIGVTSFTTSDNEMVVLTTQGQNLVDTAGAGVLSYTVSGNINANTVLSGLTLNGVDITSTVDSGAMGSLLRIRDTILPGLTAQLNQFANNLFNATAVTQSGVRLATTGGNPAAGDTFTATVDGTTYTTAGLPANPTMTDVANALNVQFRGATIAVGGTAAQAGDVFSVTINGASYTTSALSGGGPFTSGDIVNAINETLTRVTVPLTVNTPATGDSFDVSINGTTYTTAGLSGGGPYTSTDIANAIQAAIPAGFTATVSGSNIVIRDTTGVLQSASIALTSGGTGTETFGPGVQATTFSANLDAGGNIVLKDSAASTFTAGLTKSAGSGGETFGAAQYTTFTASANSGDIVITDSSGNPLTATLATNPMFTAGTPNNSGTPTTIDFTLTSGSLNIGQTFDIVVDGTDYGSTAALATGATALTDVAAAIQTLFTSKGLTFTASVVGGNIEIADPAANPITAGITVSAGAGTEAFTPGVPTSPLNTINSGLGATNDKNHFFAGVDLVNGLDNAGTIVVNPSLVANTSLLLQGASGPDPSIAQNLFGNLGQNYTFAAAGSFTNASTTSLANYSGQIIGQAASASAAANSDATFQTQLQSQIETQAGSVSGVNIDDELGNLIQYQNTYSANARVMTVIQTLYDTLMRM